MKYNYYNIQVTSTKYCTSMYSYLRTILFECTFCIVSMKIKYYNQKPQWMMMYWYVNLCLVFELNFKHAGDGVTYYLYYYNGLIDIFLKSGLIINQSKL